jgi:O-antigen/teichoic acid export membrane protein
MNDEYRPIAENQGSNSKPVQTSFAIDVFTLVGGTTIAQIIAILASPVVTRLYGADAYGISALFLSLVSTIAVIACLRYEMAIVLPKSDKEAANLLVLCIFITSIICLILIPVLWLFRDILVEVLNAPELLPYLWLIPLMVFLTGSFSAINYWNSRRRQFGRLSRTQIAKAVSTSGTQVGVGFAGYASEGSLIGAGFFGQVVATLTLGYQAWKSDKKIIKSSVSWIGMRTVSKQYRNFPIYDIWSALLNTITLQLPIFILSAFFTSAIVGYYSLGLTVLLLPMSFIGSAIAQVFFQRAAEAKHDSKKRYASVIESTTRQLISLGCPIILLMSIIGEEAFTVVFGPSWAEAGVYAQILSFWIAIQFVTSPVSTSFAILNKQKIMLLINVAVLIIRAVALVIGGIYNNIYLCLVLFSVSGIITYALVGRWVLIESGVSVLKILKSISKNLIFAFILLVIVILEKSLLPFGSTISLILGLMTILPYYIALFFQDNEVNSMFKALLHKGEHF